MSNVVKIKRVQSLDIIEKQRGKFFTVVFSSKTDGRECVINCRTGVKKFLKRKKTLTESNQDDITTVFSLKKMAYRNIYLDGIKEIRAGNIIYSFE